MKPAHKPIDREAVTAAFRAAATAITPELLQTLIRQYDVLVRSAARRNDPEPDDKPMVAYEVLRDQLAEMRRRLPEVMTRAALMQAADRKQRTARILCLHDPAARKAERDAVRDRFRDRPRQPWQDDMSGVRDPDPHGSAEPMPA